MARVKAFLPRLTAPELRELAKAVCAALEQAEASPPPAESRAEDAQKKRRSVVYRLEEIRCGRKIVRFQMLEDSFAVSQAARA